jgi:hypothetical protein
MYVGVLHLYEKIIPKNIFATFLRNYKWLARMSPNARTELEGNPGHKCGKILPSLRNLMYKIIHSFIK